MMWEEHASHKNFTDEKKKQERLGRQLSGLAETKKSIFLSISHRAESSAAARVSALDAHRCASSWPASRLCSRATAGTTPCCCGPIICLAASTAEDGKSNNDRKSESQGTRSKYHHRLLVGD
jgi:hypothetical protein